MRTEVDNLVVIMASTVGLKALLEIIRQGQRTARSLTAKDNVAVTNLKTWGTVAAGYSCATGRVPPSLLSRIMQRAVRRTSPKPSFTHPGVRHGSWRQQTEAIRSSQNSRRRTRLTRLTFGVAARGGVYIGPLDVQQASSLCPLGMRSRGQQRCSKWY